MTCDINKNSRCPSAYPYYGVMLHSGSTKYRVALSVRSMTRIRDQTTWSWYGGNNNNSIGQCDVSFYSLQSSPVCDEYIEISSDGRNMSWTCTVDNVYPEMDCRFQYWNESGNNISVSSDHVESNKVTTDGIYPPRTVYHNYTCAMNLPISEITGAGSYQFQFRGSVRVNVLGGVTTRYKETDSKPLTLAFPQVELIDCPNPQDYIKEGDTKTCGCRIKTQGTPPGQPVWLDSNGNLVGNDVSNGVKHLSLKYSSKYPNPIYYCRGVSSLGSGSDVVYTPKFAYGPSQISVSFNYNNRQCEETISFTTYCDIAKVNVNAKPTVMVTASDGSAITPQQESSTSGYYRYKFKVFPKGGAITTITCQATNAIFSDLTTTKSKTITILEPPLYAPVMTATISNNKQTVENGGIVTVTSGDAVQVQCRVDGGFPGVREVTTVCAGVTNVITAVEATQMVNVKEEDNGRNCYCKADHVTGCYDKTTEFILNVQYTPSVTGYKANSESQNLTVPANKTVTFICDVEGNPRPSVSVKGQRSGKTVALRNSPSGQYGQRGIGNKRMTCQDTDEYICMADNGVGDGVASNVSVFVECVPELPSGFGDAVKLFSLNSGTDLKVAIPIIGYPEPREYTLAKVANQNRRRRRRSAVTGEVDKSSYSVTYMKDQPPNGKVVLTMFGMTRPDVGQYVLNIDNGIEEGLDYTFIVIFEKNADTDDDSSLKGETGIGIGLAIGLVLCVVCFFVGYRVHKMRSSREKEEAPTQRMSHHSKQQPHREQELQQQHQHQQQQQHKQSQQQQMQEEEEEDEVEEDEDPCYQEIAEDNYEMFTVNGVSKLSGRHRDRSQGNLYDGTGKNSPQQKKQKQKKEAPSRNRQIRQNDNNTVNANDTHQKKSQIYLNVAMSPQGKDNHAYNEHVSRRSTSSGIYEGIITDPM